MFKWFSVTTFVNAGKWVYNKYDNLSPEQKAKIQEAAQKVIDKVMKKDE